MRSSLRRVMEQDLARAERLIQECRAELDAAEAVVLEKKKTICEAEVYRDKLKAFLESEESGFWSRFGESEAGTPPTMNRTAPTLKTTFEGLKNAKKHVDRMVVYALGNSGRVVPREAAELLIALGISDSRSRRSLSKNLATVMGESDEFVKEPDGAFVHVEFLASGGNQVPEQTGEGNVSCPAEAENGGDTVLVPESGGAQV